MSEPILKNSKYRFLQKISEGQASTISLVEFEGKRYAYKSLKTSDPDSLLRFRRESSTLARLNHPNLVKLFDAGEQNSEAFLVMEYLEGQNLATRLTADHFLSEEESIKIVSSVAEALAELHKNNLVHRDIKPGNIMILKEGSKLIDLGLVGDVEQIKSETALVGTPLYCSPEQTKILQRNVTFASDLYSLGIVFYEILNGTPPFTGSLNDILQQHTSTPVPNLRLLKPGLKQSVVAIIEKLLAKDPDDRYQSSQGLISDLRRLDEIDSLLSQKKDPRLGGKEKQSFAVRIKYIERKSETENLHKAWSETRSGNPGFFIVKGASGSGKSRLCSEFINHALDEEKNETLILKGKSQFSNQEIPFGPIREALDTLIASVSNDSPEVQSLVYGKLIAAAKGRETRLLQFSKSLNKVFKKNIHENVETDIEGEREKFFNDVAEFFISLSQQWKGLILYLDDLQWMDGSSIHLLEILMSHSGKHAIFVLGTARNDEKSATAMKNFEETFGATIKCQFELSGFTKNQMADLLSSYLGASQLETAIVDFLYSKSTGNPFIAIEYLRAVVEQGFLAFKNNQWQMVGQGLEKLTFSSDVYDLIVKRIEKGSPALISFLRYAAIYGNTFVASDISEVAEIHSSHLKAVLTEGEGLGLIDSVGGERWKFSHDKVPESLRQTLTAEITKQKCDNLSDFYRKKMKFLSDDEVFILARLASSGNFEKNLTFTVEANIAAGNLSLTNHAHAQAYVFLKCAYELMDKAKSDRTIRIDVVSKLAVCAAMVADWALADECVKLALSLSKGKDEMASSYALRLWVKLTRGDFSTAWESFREASFFLDSPYPAYLLWKSLATLWYFFAVMFLRLTHLNISFLVPPKSKRGKSLSKLADLYFVAQYSSEYKQLLDFIYVSLRILFIGLVTGKKRELALGYACTGYAFASLGVKRMAVPFLNEAMRLGDEINDPVIKATCMARRIDGFIFCGVTYNESKDYLENFDSIKGYLNPIDLGRLNITRSLLLSFKGRNAEAVNFLKSYLNLQNPIASKLPVISMLNSLHQYWFNLSLLGYAHEAQQFKRVALKISSPYRFVPVAHRHVAVYELALRRYTEEVDERVNDLREHYMGNFAMFTEVTGKLNFSQIVYLDLFELERAKGREEQFSKRKNFKLNLQRLYFMLYSPLFRINYYFLKAMYHRIVGQYSAAEKWLRTCEKIVEETDNLRIMFEIHRERARIHLKKGEIMLMQSNLLSAIQMAVTNQWGLTEEALITEFGQYAQQLLVNMGRGAVEGGQASDQATIQKGHSGVRSPPVTATIQGPSSDRNSTQNNMTIVSNDAEQLRFVDALLKVSQAFVSSLDMLEQSKSILTQIVKLFAAERGFVFIKNEGMDGYQPLTGKNAQGEDIAVMTGYSTTMVKKVFDTGQPLIIASSEEAEALGSESAVLHNLRSVIVTPLTIKERVLGAVYLDSSLMKGLFTKRDSYLFSTLANNISVAIELSRMAKVELEKAELRKELEIQAAIAGEAKKVKVLVDNMQQALFSIAPDGTIVEPVSKFSQKVLGHKVVGEKLAQTLYKDVSDKEVLAGIDAALNTIFGEDELQWDLMSDHFPRKVRYVSGSEKTLRVQPSPVWDGEENLEKVVFVVEDVTALEALERKVEEQGVQATLLKEILESDLGDLAEFINNCTKVIESLKSLGKSFTAEGFATMLRDLHTLKGNARLFKMSLLSGEIHETESQLLVFKENLADQDVIQKVFTPAVARIEGALKQYQEIYGRISPVRSASVGGIGVSELALQLLNGTIADLEKDLSPKKRQKLNWAIERLSFKSVNEIAQKFSPMVDDISKQLGKRVEFSVDGDALISHDRSQLLRECLVHLIRNSIDHGLESEADRVKAGKTDVGHLRVECSEALESTSISISDDGNGIDGDMVLKRALQKGIVTEVEAKKMSNDEKINLIFSPNFSTKTEVSEISGRGIGLDVVKKNIETMSGELKVVTERGKGSKFMILLRTNESLDEGSKSGAGRAAS